MRRAKLGDVYAFKTERGYRIIQWVYHIEKMGRYIKVFPGFYEKEPENLAIILQGDCSYIVTYYIPPLLKKGILEFWGNYEEFIVEPFPKYMIGFQKYGNQILFRVANSMRAQDDETYIGDSSGQVIPRKYKDVRLLNLIPSTIFFLHMLSSDFDLKHFDLLWGGEREMETLREKYKDIL